ncbi:MAG: hypothetical protein JXA82_00935 [Sedimentisphaerales bacterium]|nr:hypothetical protein [Sedimentisphaerales bacterium]
MDDSSHQFIPICKALVLSISLCFLYVGASWSNEGLDPVGKMHIPIGLANTLDTLKTFVEAEGCFSPGVGSYGIYCWIYDESQKKLYAPTMPEIVCERGLGEAGKLLPWIRFQAGKTTVKLEICQVAKSCPGGLTHIVAGRVHLRNRSQMPNRIQLYIALRPIGPAGFDVYQIGVGSAKDALLVEGHPAVVSLSSPTDAGVIGEDRIGDYAFQDDLPDEMEVQSNTGNSSGALQYDLRFEAGQGVTVEFLCPVLAGRRAAGHQWDGIDKWAQFDQAQLNPEMGGKLQPDPGLDFYRKLDIHDLFVQARRYWEDIAGRVYLQLPDRRWTEAFGAIIGHVTLSMNEGAPDVAVVNYNVFNRDGVYVANILQKAGQYELAAEAIDYFLSYPFNGRSYPEADNPGQILWAMEQQWRFTHDRSWLKEVYPSARKLANMIHYYRTTPPPHWVQMDALVFGEDVPQEKRRKLEPGRCDGHHPEYTEAFDLAGIRSMAILAGTVGFGEDVDKYKRLANDLFEQYDGRFGKRLTNEYGSYCVLWPCRLYDFQSGKAWEQCKNIGAQTPSEWRYFALARAHQGLLAGNRQAGYGTISLHLDHEQMQGWYAFDEGGKSGSGGWGRLRTTWNGNVAMPHGWAIAELFLLIRDSLVYEHQGRLILFAGVDPQWLLNGEGMEIRNLPTHYGRLDLQYRLTSNGATLSFGNSARPPRGFVLMLPEDTKATAVAAEGFTSTTDKGQLPLPWIAGRVDVTFNE